MLFRSIISVATNYLSLHGLIALEHGYDQSIAVTDLLKDLGWVDIQIHHDLAGIPRAASAKLS